MQLVRHEGKNEIGSRSHSNYENQFHVDQRLNVESKIVKLLEEHVVQ